MLHPTAVSTGSAFIVGSNYGKISSCVNNADISASLSKKGQFNFGAICGRCYSKGSVNGCRNNGDITISITDPTAMQYIGGITGILNHYQSSVRASDCVNTGNITVTEAVTTTNKFRNLFVGGIVGASGLSVGDESKTYGYTNNYGQISSCVNVGSIKVILPTGATGGYTLVGGIVSYFEGSVVNCINGESGSSGKGSVTLDADRNPTTRYSRPSVGGVAAYVSRTISGCHNYGPVSMTGLFGAAESAYTYGCGTFKRPTCGGIVACAGDGIAEDEEYGIMDYGIVTDCHNHGTVTVNSGMTQGGVSSTGCGGVVGWSHSVVSNCDNEGVVNIDNDCCTANFGGVCGRADADISSCSNKAAVTISHTMMESAEDALHRLNVGGVVGYAHASVYSCSTTASATLKVNDSSAADTRVGGVVGMYSERSDTGRSFKDCTNNAAFSFTKTGDFESTMYYGGVAGYVLNGELVLSGHVNNGALTPTMCAANVDSYVGGVIGMTLSSTVKDCQNTGSITLDCGGSTSRVFAGGIAGRIPYCAFNIESCKNTGNIDIKNKVGNDSENYCTVGGVYGGWEDKYSNSISNCYSLCNISFNSTGAVRMGGIAGCLYGTIVGKNDKDTPEYKGKLTVSGTTSDISEIGGVAGYFGGPVTGVNARSTIVSNKGYAAGMVGYYNYSKVSASLEISSAVDHNWITTTVTGAMDMVVGGLFGFADAPVLNLNSCVVSATIEDGYLGGLIGLVPANKNFSWGENGGSVRTTISGGTCGIICGAFQGTFTEKTAADVNRTIDLGYFGFCNCVINGTVLWDRRTDSGFFSESSNSSLLCGDYKNTTQNYSSSDWNRNHVINTSKATIFKENDAESSDKYPVR